MNQIDEQIQAANLQEHSHVWSGQCLTIAKAIQEVHSGKIVFVSEIPYEGFDHACVEIDGKLYDGSGKVGWTETLNRFVPKEAHRENIDNNFFSIENPTEEFSSSFDQSVYQDARSRLEQQLN